MSLNKTILAFLTPVVAAGSAWLTAAVAKYGVHLDPSGVNALAAAGATAGAAVMVKLIHDLERSKVAKEVEAVVKPVDAALVAADPDANRQLEDVAAQLQAAAEARFAELVAKIPTPPVEAVPDPPPAAA